LQKATISSMVTVCGMSPPNYDGRHVLDRGEYSSAFQHFSTSAGQPLVLAEAAR